MQGERATRRLPASLFLSAPSALSVAIGRVLNPNAAGEVTLMAYDASRGYFKAVTIPPKRE